MARNRSSLGRTLKRLNQRRKDISSPSSPYTPAPRVGMGMDRGSGSSGSGKPLTLQQIVDRETKRRTDRTMRDGSRVANVSGKDPNAPKVTMPDGSQRSRMLEVVGADSTYQADRFIRENPKDFVRMSPGIVEARKSNPRFDPDTGKPKKFMDTAQGRQFFTPTDKNAEGAKFVKEFGTYGLLSDPAEIPEEGVRDIRPKFTDPKTGKTVFTNPRAEVHRNFAAKIREKGGGYWNRPENARELANLLNEAPSKGLTSAQVMRYIDKQDKEAVYEKDSAEGMDFVQGVVRSETGSDPADIAFSRKRAYPDQGKNSNFLKKFKRQMGRRNKGRGKGKGRGQISALADAFKNLPPNLQEELVKNNPNFSSLLPAIIPNK